jgi:hypothetical protein
MMATLFSTQRFAGDEVSKAMLDGLTSRIRTELKAIILERIESDVNAAVDAAIDGLKTAIETYRDHVSMRDVIRIIVDRKDLASPLPLKESDGK